MLILFQTSNVVSSEYTSILQLMAQIGLSAVFLWQWRDEKTQRIKRDDQLLAFTQQFAPLVSDAIKALNAYDKTVTESVRKVAGLPDRSDIDVATRRMEQATDAITSAIQEMASRRRSSDDRQS